MKRKLLIIFFALLFSGSISYSQVDQSIFDSLDNTENEYYKLSYPDKWRTSILPPYLNWFEGSGIGFPIEYNGSPIIIVVFTSVLNGKDFDMNLESFVKGYRENKDRVFPEGFKEIIEDFPIDTFKAKLISTKFYRKSKNLDQSRFDLLVQNSNGDIIDYGISIQYGDPTYELENLYKLKEFAKRVFSLIKPK